jgi:hypothetical protein
VVGSGNALVVSQGEGEGDGVQRGERNLMVMMAGLIVSRRRRRG